MESVNIKSLKEEMLFKTFKKVENHLLHFDHAGLDVGVLTNTSSKFKKLMEEKGYFLENISEDTAEIVEVSSNKILSIFGLSISRIFGCTRKVLRGVGTIECLNKFPIESFPHKITWFSVARTQDELDIRENHR